MTGFYLMHRGWLDHPAFGGKREPYCRRSAWMWLIENARWRPGREDVGGRTVQLMRGQLCCSYRFLAEAWGWSLAAVQRYLDRLETDTMVKRTAEHGRLIITICKYDDYQLPARIERQLSDTATDTEAIRGRYAGDTNKNEGNEGNEGNNLSLTGEGTPASAEQGVVTTPPANDNPKRGRQGTLVPDGDLPDEWAAAANHSREKHLMPLLSRRVLNLRWESFQNYWRGVTGSKGLKRDWRATWLNDCIDSRTEKRFPPEGGVGPPADKPRPQLLDILKSNDKY